MGQINDNKQNFKSICNYKIEKKNKFFNLNDHKINLSIKFLLR